MMAGLLLIAGAAWAQNPPDMVITDLMADGPYVKARYTNQGGAGKGDFLIRFCAHRKCFDGNSYYRFPVPRPGESAETGGVTLGLMDIKQGETVTVTAEIDWERRVTESTRKNNIFEKVLKIPMDAGEVKIEGPAEITLNASSGPYTVTVRTYDSQEVPLPEGSELELLVGTGAEPVLELNSYPPMGAGVQPVQKYGKWYAKLPIHSGETRGQFMVLPLKAGAQNLRVEGTFGILSVSTEFPITVKR